MERDRDAAGRARNARPRDGAGRPLPYGSVGVPRVPDHLVLAPAEALVEAERLLGAGCPFQAHEILEGVWKSAPGGEAALWQGLAQLAVGLAHVHRGNRVGAVTILRRGAGNLSAYATPHGIPVAALRAWALGLADEIDATGPAAASDAERTRPRLY